MTTYNIGPGQTYETFTALKAAVTLVPDDIVNGGDNVFQELWSLPTSGTDGHPIRYQDATVDGEGARSQGVNAGAKAYIEIDNLTLINAISYGYFGEKAAILTNIIVSDAVNGIYFRNLTTGLINLDGFVVSDTTVGVYVTASTCDFSIANGSVTASDFGIRFFNNVLTDSMLENFVATANADHGISVDGSSNITFSFCGVTYSGRDGIRFDNAADGCELIGGNYSYSGVDGISFQTASKNTKISRAKVSYNGQEDVVANGDGITAHAGSVGIEAAFNLLIGNKNAAFAMVGDSSGEIYHNTTYNNGDQTSVNMGVRAELYLVTTGAWTIKNNVFCNLEDYTIAWCAAVPALTADYNAYISSITPTGAPFSVGGVGKTWSEWITAVGNETNSYYIYFNGTAYEWYKGDAPTTLLQTTTYCPVTSEGRLVSSSSNLLFDTGAVIAGVNDGGELDPWGNVTDSTPNIGAYQGSGVVGGKMKGRLINWFRRRKLCQIR